MKKFFVSLIIGLSSVSATSQVSAFAMFFNYGGDHTEKSKSAQQAPWTPLGSEKPKPKPDSYYIKNYTDRWETRWGTCRNSNDYRDNHRWYDVERGKGICTSAYKSNSRNEQFMAKFDAPRRLGVWVFYLETPETGDRSNTYQEFYVDLKVISKNESVDFRLMGYMAGPSLIIGASKWGDNPTPAAELNKFAEALMKGDTLEVSYQVMGGKTLVNKYTVNEYSGTKKEAKSTKRYRFSLKGSKAAMQRAKNETVRVPLSQGWSTTLKDKIRTFDPSRHEIMIEAIDDGLRRW